MSTANPVRGEVPVTLGGTAYILRPSFSALVAVESEVGPILELAQAAAQARVRVDTVATVFHHCLQLPEGAERPSPEAIGDWILADGMIAALKAYRTLLENVLGGRDSSA